MPSGAKKRKAAKKKLQNNGSHLQGSGDVERESPEEVVGGTSLVGEEESLGEIDKELKVGEKSDDGSVDTSRESQNEDASEEHKSSSSSGSDDDDDDEVEVEKEKPVVEVSVEHIDCVPEVGLSEDDPVTSEVVERFIEESIPVEESVKEVVSLSPESSLVTESVPVENSTISDVVELELKQSMNEVSVLSGEQHNVSEEIETKVIQVLGNGSEDSSKSADNPANDKEGLSSIVSGVATADRSGGNGHAIESEKLKYSEKQPLISSAPPPVRQTSLMNCCGLFEVFSGGSDR